METFSGRGKIMNCGVVNYNPKLTCPFSKLRYNVQKEFSYIYGIKNSLLILKEPTTFPCLEPQSEVLTS
jgi:hypothetical protein